MASVDVIVPCYKYARFLRGCVESILTQVGVDVRVLIIDDCSPDNTAEVAQELANQDRRVTFLRHETNRGNINTYNEGLDWATADYTLILSADDVLLPGALGRAARLMDAHPDVGLVHGRMLVHLAGTPWPQPQTGSEYEWEVCDGLKWLERLCQEWGNGIDSPTVVVRTALQHRLGRFRQDLRYSADIEIWSRFALHGSIGIIHADQAIYRVHGTNMHLEVDHNPVIHFQNRYGALHHAFATYRGDNPRVREIEQATYRMFAKEALWLACKAYDLGEVDKTPVQVLKDFALQVYDKAAFLPEYAGLTKRMRYGPRVWRLLRRAAFWKKRPRKPAVPLQAAPPLLLSLR